MENIVLGLQVTIIGMGIVLIGLSALAVFTWLLPILCEDTRAEGTMTGKDSKKDEGVLPEIMAVISAVVSIQGRNSYKINTIKRLDGQYDTLWTRLRRHEQYR